MAEAIDFPTVSVELTPPTRSNYSPYPLDLKHGGLFVVMHDTDNQNAGVGAKAHSRWQDNEGSGGGAQAGVLVHFYVDGDFGIVQKHPLDLIGYHAGDGCNDVVTDVGCFRSVSIEMCVNSDDDHAGMVWNAAMLVAMIANGDARFAWGTGDTRGKFSIDRILRHANVAQGPNGHYGCPANLKTNRYGFTWGEFLALVDEAWNDITRKPVSRIRYGKAIQPSFMTKDPLKEVVRSRKIQFRHDESVWEATEETPSLVAPDRSSRNTTAPMMTGDRAKFYYISFNGNWGLTKAGAYIPLQYMRRV